MEKLALLIAVDEYHYQDSLSNSRSDAKAFREILKANFDYQDSEIVLMTGPGSDNAGTATKDSVLKCLDEISTKSDVSFLAFGFWGHGLLGRNNQTYLCLTDTKLGLDENGESNLEATGISIEVFKKKLAAIGANENLLLFDCCQDVEHRGGGDHKLGIHELNALKDFNDGLHSNIKETNSMLLLACRKGQRAYEWPERQHGIFTACLIDGFKSGKSKISEIVEEAFEEAEKVAESKRKVQQPTCFTAGRFIQIPRATPLFEAENRNVLTEEKIDKLPPRLHDKKSSRLWWIAALLLLLLALIPRLVIKLSHLKEDDPAEPVVAIEVKDADELDEVIQAAEPEIDVVEEASALEAVQVVELVEDVIPEAVHQNLTILLPGEIPLELIAISKDGLEDYWIGKVEITQEQWKAITGEEPSTFRGRDNFPVETITWNEARVFCDKLSDYADRIGALPDGYRFDLPTERQWEAAIIGDGTEGFDYTDASLVGTVAWYRNNTGNEHYADDIAKKQGLWAALNIFSSDEVKVTSDTYSGPFKVGSRQPAPMGHYDMIGNVSEWCRAAETKSSENSAKRLHSIQMAAGFPFTNSIASATDNYLIAQRDVDEGKNFTVTDSPDTTVFNLKTPSVNRHYDDFEIQLRVSRGGDWLSLLEDCNPQHRELIEGGAATPRTGLRVALIPDQDGSE